MTGPVRYRAKGNILALRAGILAGARIAMYRSFCGALQVKFRNFTFIPKLLESSSANSSQLLLAFCSTSAYFIKMAHFPDAVLMNWNKPVNRFRLWFI
jgi:hypothetical protein